MDAHDTLVRRLVFLLVFFVVIAERRFELSPRNPKSLLGPGAEIDQLTTIRAKRPVWIIVPRAFSPASGAFHTQRHGFLLSYVM
jgi:hypothetical protein